MQTTLYSRLYKLFVSSKVAKLGLSWHVQLLAALLSSLPGILKWYITSVLLKLSVESCTTVQLVLYSTERVELKGTVLVKG